MIVFQPQTALQVPSLALPQGQSPDAVVFSGVLYFFYGKPPNGISYTWSPDGVTWNQQLNQITNSIGLSIMEGTNPSAVVFAGSLYIFFNGSGNNGVWYTSSTQPQDPNQWQTVQQVPDTLDLQWGTTPEAVVYEGTLYVFYVGEGIIKYTSLTSNLAWSSSSTPTALPDTTATTILSGAVFNGQLFLAYSSSAFTSASITCAVTEDLNGWTNVSPGVVGTSPAAVALSSPSVVQVYWVNNGSSIGATNTNDLMVASWDGTTWSPTQSVVSGPNTQAAQVVDGTGPCAAVFNSLPYVFWVSGTPVYYTTGEEYPNPQNLGSFDFLSFQSGIVQDISTSAQEWFFVGRQGDGELIWCSSPSNTNEFQWSGFTPVFSNDPPANISNFVLFPSSSGVVCAIAYDTMIQVAWSQDDFGSSSQIVLPEAFVCQHLAIATNSALGSTWLVLAVGRDSSNNPALYQASVSVDDWPMSFDPSWEYWGPAVGTPSIAFGESYLYVFVSTGNGINSCWSTMNNDLSFSSWSSMGSMGTTAPGGSPIAFTVNQVSNQPLIGVICRGMDGNLYYQFQISVDSSLNGAWVQSPISGLVLDPTVFNYANVEQVITTTGTVLSWSTYALKERIWTTSAEYLQNGQVIAGTMVTFANMFSAIPILFVSNSVVGQTQILGLSSE